MSTELVLGIDIGSTTSKAALVSLDGRLVALEEIAHEISRPRPGWAEQDAEAVWWADVVALCRRLLPPAGGGRVVAAAGAALGPCLVLADAAGRPLRPAILYGIDTRATAEIEELDRRLGPAAILARCGSPLTTQAIGPKLAWLARHEPDVLAAARRLFTASSFLVHRLTGEYVLDHHSASQCVPMYDVLTNAWIDEWAAETAPGSSLPPLPPLAWPQEPAGVVPAAAAAATGLPAGIPVAAGTIDSLAEAFGAGVRRPGELLLAYGTTMFMAEVMTTARPDPRLWSPASFVAGSRNLAAGTATAGALAAWVRDLTGASDFSRLTAEAREVPPGAAGVVMLPYLSGERTPLFDPRARGVIAGLSLSHTRAHVFRAALEGIAFAVRHNLDVMREAGSRPERFVASDAELKGVLWPQIVSDVTGLEQAVLEAPAVATVGSALLAAIAGGRADLSTDWSGERVTVAPDAAATAAYDAPYRIYRELYPATRDQQHALADLAGGPGAGASVEPSASPQEPG
jgi:xylulokinase